MNVPLKLIKNNPRAFKKRMKWAMEIHDQVLDKRGPVSTTHRCNPLPFDEKLRRKKKFRFVIENPCITTHNFVDTLREARKRPQLKESAKVKELVMPFTNVTDRVVEESNLQENFHELCKRGPNASVYRIVH